MLKKQDLSVKTINDALNQEQVLLNCIGELCGEKLLNDLVPLVLDYLRQDMPKVLRQHNGYWDKIRPRFLAWKAFYYPKEDFISLRKLLLDCEQHFSDEEGCYAFKNLVGWQLFILRDHVGFMDCRGEGAFIYEYVMIQNDGTKFLFKRLGGRLLSPHIRHATLKDVFLSISTVEYA